MRYQQQRAQISPNCREKGAMSIQKLMASGAHLHQQQSEEIMRLRRNVSSMAKKNHELKRQVHELALRLQQYPPPRIPVETRPKLQANSEEYPPSDNEDDRSDHSMNDDDIDNNSQSSSSDTEMETYTETPPPQSPPSPPPPPPPPRTTRTPPPALSLPPPKATT